MGDCQLSNPAPGSVPRTVHGSIHGSVGAARGRWGDLGPRAASGAVLVAAAVVTTWVGGALFVLTWLAAAIAVNWEWQALTGGSHRRSRIVTGTVAMIALAIVTARPASTMPAFMSGDDTVLIASMLGMACGLSALLAGGGGRVWAAGGVLYAGLLFLAVVALRFSTPFGARAIVWLFATVWSTDIFAYLGGRLIGGPKLWPRVSPSKTWAGTVTGVAVGTLAGSLVATGGLASSPTAIAVLTFVAALLSQVGDAFESSVKRRFGVKDSGCLIPGHGGVMDRLDGFIAAAVFALMVGLARHMPSTVGGLFP